MEKGIQRTSSIGQPFTIWKIGCLDENTISFFLFGDAYQKSREEKIGSVFALFNCSVRKDSKVRVLMFCFGCPHKTSPGF